jgi:hypothetical protein
VPVGPDVPPNIRQPLQDLENRLLALEQPGAPQRVFVIASTDLSNVDPALYRNAGAWISDLKTLAVSDGTDWIRQDTQGAL